MEVFSDEEMGFDQVNFDDQNSSLTFDDKLSEKKEVPDDDYGKKVQRRINKEVAKRKILEDKNLELQQRLDEVEEKVNNQTKEGEIASVDQEILNLKARRKELYASEDDDALDKIDEITDELADLRHQRNSLANSNSQENSNNKKTNNNGSVEQQGDQSRVSEAEQNWLSANSDWFGHGGEKQSKAFIVAKELNKEGFDHTDSSFYEELDSRLNENFKNSEREAEPTGATTNQSRSNVEETEQGNVKFTNKDRMLMDRLQLDPDDPKQRQKWLKEKQVNS